jgi:DNA-binding LytR/AlgR family response regulator
MTNEEVRPEHFAKWVRESNGPEKLDEQESVAGTLLLENIAQIDGDSAHVNRSTEQSAQGVLLITTDDWRSQAYYSLPASFESNQKVEASEPVDTAVKVPRSAKESESKTGESKTTSYLPIKSSRKVVLLNVEDLDWIQSAHNHVILHAGKQSHRLRGTLDSFEQKLPQNKFVRISRSKIVQIARIKELELLVSRACRLKLHDGTSLTLSRRYRGNFQELGLL